METLIKQMRVRFSGVGQENKDEPSSIKDRKIPPQKTQSFKGDKSQNWIRRQFSRQTSRDYDSGEGGDYTTAIAAAAFAINSLEELSKQEEKGSESPEMLLTKIKTKKEDTPVSIPGPAKVPKQFSGEASFKSSQGQEMVPTSATERKMPEKVVGPSPSIKKAPTFAAKPIEGIASTKPQSGLPKPNLPSTIQPAQPPSGTRRQGLTKPIIEETKADAWEKTEMAKIKERYEKLNSTILSWEDKKKKRAKRQMEKTESELERRRARALQQYRNEMESINKIAGGARAQAEERRRNKEIKVKKKANEIRSTGKVPKACCYC